MDSKKDGSKEGYHRFTLQPLDPEEAIRFSEFSRMQVKATNFWVGSIFCCFCAVSAVIGIMNGHFKNLSNGLAPNLVYFVFTLGLGLIALITYFIPQKWSVAIDLGIPIYGLWIAFALLPSWFEDLDNPTYFKG